VAGVGIPPASLPARTRRLPRGLGHRSYFHHAALIAGKEHHGEGPHDAAPREDQEWQHRLTFQN
jgi:hypothetical protein